MANQTYGTNCASLDTRTSFASYVKEISAITGFQEPLLEACKSAICTTLWGSGNADVSGIGVCDVLEKGFFVIFRDFSAKI